MTYYIDTSVFGGIYDIEFRSKTEILFHQILSEQSKILYSEITLNELKNAPQNVKDFVANIPNQNIQYIELTNEAIVLAEEYLSVGVVGKASRNDCLHIALATLHKTSVLVSWNFKHIVNLPKIRGYNSVNTKLGYANVEIRSPLDLINYE